VATPEILEMMKRSGCVFIDYGIEQFDNDALKAMDKKQTEEDIVSAIEFTQRAGIYVAFNIIFGNLGDTPNTLKKSMSLLKKYNDFGQLRAIRPVTPYPGSPLYYHAIKNGLLKGPADFYEKHRNIELMTVNFTNLSDEEFYRLIVTANTEIITDYYNHLKDNLIKSFKNTYFGKDFSFRGARHNR
jgi:radical SAM superfamily enzyme YgiQ (UPF0313 family)